ncbi:unnamed protein product, partial [Ectocarpus sp. 12 AP-2014]
KSALVDLGRTALKAMNAEEAARSPPGPNRDAFLSFAKACYVRASSSSKAHGGNNPPAGGGGKDEGGSAVSPGSFRARLEFL